MDPVYFVTNLTSLDFDLVFSIMVDPGGEETSTSPRSTVAASSTTTTRWCMWRWLPSRFSTQCSTDSTELSTTYLGSYKLSTTWTRSRPYFSSSSTWWRCTVMSGLKTEDWRGGEVKLFGLAIKPHIVVLIKPYLTQPMSDHQSMIYLLV